MVFDDTQLDELDERILAELKAFQAAQRTSDAALASENTRRWPGRRRAVLSGIAMLAIAAVVGVALTSNRGPDHQTASMGRSAGLTTPSNHNLTARTIAAVAEANTRLIVHSSSTTADSRTEVWLDFTTNSNWWRHEDASGKPRFASGARWDSARTGTVRTIDYLTRTWSERTFTVPDSLPAPQLPDPATALRDQLEHDTIVDQRTEAVDGKAVTVITMDNHTKIWIDQATGLPLEQVGPAGATTYEWLPRSADQLASLWPPTPPGFTQVPFALPTPKTSGQS